jgi:hypothetical protein
MTATAPLRYRIVDAIVRWPALVSDRASQLGERCGDPVMTGYIDGVCVVAAADVLHEGVPGDDHLRGPISSKSAHRSELVFELTVIGLDRPRLERRR